MKEQNDHLSDLCLQPMLGSVHDAPCAVAWRKQLIVRHIVPSLVAL